MQCGPMVWRTQDWGPTTAIMEYLNVTLQVTYYQDTALAEISKVFTPPTPHTHTYHTYVGMTPRYVAATSVVTVGKRTYA